DKVLKLGAGWVTKIKERNSEHFVPMSTDAGAPVERGVATAGVNYIGPNGSLGAIYYFSPDVISIGYAEAKYWGKLTENVGLLGAAQFADQRSNRSDELTGTSFAANQVGAKLEASWLGAIGTLAYTNTTSGADIETPWSSCPGYTSVQVENF